MIEDSGHRDDPPNEPPLTAWFLGPKAEQGDLWYDLVSYIFQDYIHWRRNYFPNDPVVITRERRREHEQWQDRLIDDLNTVLNNLKAHFPFYSPRYIAHMISEQTLPGVLGYFAGMLYDPNNVTDESAPVTVKLELEVGRMVSEMLGYKPNKAWAHICSGGTVANIEALWVARMVQFLPFIMRDYCKEHRLDFTVKTANAKTGMLRDLNDRELIGLRPNESIFMVRKLARYEVDTIGREQNAVLDGINLHIQNSDYNVKLRGYDAVIGKLKMRPVIYVSAAAHYSVTKAANVLGYGEDSVRTVPVNSKFRLDVSALHAMLERLGEHEYVASVIGIVGTTEQGAVDPIHEIAGVRHTLSHAKNESFWLHVDAAWGGYIRSIFLGHAADKSALEKKHRSLDETCKWYIDAIAAQDKVTHHYFMPEKSARPNESWETIAWDNPDVYKAFIAMADADSITVDPHKMGYIPYPAGIVAFKNGLVTELMTQKALYISDEMEGIKSIDELLEIKAVGPYILEGSKPGAAATACWLAHKTIPLNVHGHGKIARATVLNAKKLCWYMQHHRRNFEAFEIECGFESRNGGRFIHPFTFLPVNKPDTNIVCFIAVPMSWNGNKLATMDMPLKWINELNRRIHDELDIPKAGRGTTMPYAKEYFVSNTTFEKGRYASHALAALLSSIHVSQHDYNEHGLLVLRSIVMNPLYQTAQAEGIDYLAGYVKHLHKVARFVISQVFERMEKEGIQLNASQKM